MPKYSVPYETVTIDIYEVDAKGPNQAILAAEELRRAGAPPTHSRTKKFGVLAVKKTLEDDPTTVANGE